MYGVHLSLPELYIQCCADFICPYQSCTDSVVLILKSAQHCLYNSGKDRYTRYMWNNDNISLLHIYRVYLSLPESYFRIVMKCHRI